MATWTEVDDAIHKAFADGRAAQRGAADVAQLVAELLEVSGPEPKEATGLPASPCRGLARLECLTPRPFYLPDQEPSDGWLNVHGAPKPVEDEAQDVMEAVAEEESWQMGQGQRRTQPRRFMQQTGQGKQRRRRLMHKTVQWKQ
ncbi:unnamed protein product [Effrenium voratum]|nr:unnamed protein product [Effrenium voratum]